MASSLNKVTLIGNIGRDPEIRNMQDGKEVATFSLATTEFWKDKSTGEKRERTEWHRIVVFAQPLVELIRRHVHKGSKLYVEGSLQTRKWQDQSGTEKYTTEIVIQPYQGSIVMLDRREGQQSGVSETGVQFEHQQLDDDIPF